MKEKTHMRSPEEDLNKSVSLCSLTCDFSIFSLIINPSILFMEAKQLHKLNKLKHC